MDEHDDIYAEARAAIEKATGLIPGAIKPGELISFLGDEQYSHYAFAQLSIEELIDIVSETRHAA